MGAEVYTVPARFLTTMAHLIATLTVLYDVENVAVHAIDEGDSLSSAKRSLLAIVVISLICFAVEIIGLFSGMSLFLPTVSSLYVFLHFVGTIFVVLWLSLEWSLTWYTWLFVIFSGFPAFVELTVAFGVLKLGLMEFS